LTAAQQSVDRGVRIYTIGVGTDHNNSIPNCGFQGGDHLADNFLAVEALVVAEILADSIGN